MRRFLAIALACIVATPLAFAQSPASPAKMQLANKMFDMNDAASIFQQLEYSVIGNIMSGIGQSLGDKATCPALQPEAVAFKGRMDTLFNGFSDAGFRQQATQAYADAFTEEEMRQIVAFMQSPAGQKMKRVNGDLFKKIDGLAETRMKAHEADIRTLASAFAGNVKNIAATCPSTPAATTPPAKK